jgi:DNA-binding NtrC family response regulator
VVGIHLPPLRERREDVPLLARALLDKIAPNLGKEALGITEETLQRLQSYDWPGNVRELENVLTQAGVHARNGTLTLDLLSLGSSAVQPAPATAEAFTAQTTGEAEILRTLDRVEAEHIQKVLDYSGGHKGRSSQILGISRPALDRKIKKYGLEVPSR